MKIITAKNVGSSVDAWVGAALQDLRDRSLLREPRAYPQAGGRLVVDGREILNFSSNDYLDLANAPAVRDASAAYLDRGAGAGASRLVTGTLDMHLELERRLAALKGYPAALVFGSGYLANVGIIPALVGRDDTVFTDRLAHASLLDGIVLSRARLERFAHNDVEHLEGLLRRPRPRGRGLVVTESVFSMDGDLAPLEAIAAVAARHGAMLLVDEAHATGVFGPGGAGRVREHGLTGQVTVSMATLSKALGGYGGFVACSGPLREWFVNRARSFVYTTALPPAVIGAALGALDALAAQPGMGRELLERALFFKSRLQTGGLDTGASASQIIPVRVGDTAKALEFSRRLWEENVLAVPIRPPTVPEGTARIRFSVTRAHGRADLERAADCTVAVAKGMGLI